MKTLQNVLLVLDSRDQIMGIYTSCRKISETGMARYEKLGEVFLYTEREIKEMMKKQEMFKFAGKLCRIAQMTVNR